VPIKDSYIASSEAAVILGLRPFVIQKLIKRGRLPGEKVANRWLIPRVAVNEMAKTYQPKVGRPRQQRQSTKRDEV